MITEEAQHEAGDQRLLIRPIELDEAFQALVNGLVGSDETDADHQLEQTDGALFNDRKDQRRQDCQAPRIDGKVGGQQPGEAILSGSVPGVLHR